MNLIRFFRPANWARSRLPGLVILSAAMVELSLSQAGVWVQEKETVHSTKEKIVEKDAKPQSSEKAQAKPPEPKKGEEKKAQGAVRTKKAVPARMIPAQKLNNAVPAAPALAPLRLAGAGMDMAQWELQVTPQARSLYRTELHFMRQVCHPTKAEFGRISQDGEPVVKTVIKDAALQMTGRTPAQRVGDKDTQADPREVLSQEIAKAVRKTLGADRADRYQKELHARIEARKRAVRDSLVARLNDTLLLSSTQRDMIAEILANKWDVPFSQTRYLMNASQYFPQIPDGGFIATLTEAQQAEWANIPKVNFAYRVTLGNVAGFAVEEEEEWDDDASTPAQQPPVKLEQKKQAANPKGAKK